MFGFICVVKTHTDLSLVNRKAPGIEEARALLDIIPDRIGHGTCIHPDAGGTQELVDFVERHSIPIGGYVKHVLPEKDCHSMLSIICEITQSYHLQIIINTCVFAQHFSCPQTYTHSVSIITIKNGKCFLVLKSLSIHQTFSR